MSSMVLADLLRHFNFTRVLSHDTKNKLVHILGYIEDSEDMIISFERLPYDDSIIPMLSDMVNPERIRGAVENNIYGWASTTIIEPLEPYDDEGEEQELPLNTRIKWIYPATDVHIAKYEAQSRVMRVETPALYNSITLPYIKSIPASRIQWVQNILDGSAEANKVIYRDANKETGFVVLPDMKWDGSLESLYWVAIAMSPEILSLRSLTSAHLPLLKNLQATIYALVKEKAGLDASQLRLFVHYQPSYYHFHVHITALSFADAPGVVSGQAHLLDTIINNIEMVPDYYQKATIPFVIGENHQLNQLWHE